MSDLSKLTDEQLLGMLSESQKSAPVSGSEPMTPIKSQMPQIGMNLARGLFMGGPLGLGSAAVGEGMKQLDEVVSRGGYKAGGTVTDLASKMGASPEVAAGTGVAGNMGVRAIPSLVGALAGKLLEPVTRNLPVVGSKALMQSALKPSSKDLASGDAAKAIDKMLSGGYDATPAGVAKMRLLVKKLSGEVDDIIKAAPGTMPRDVTVRPEMIEQLTKFRNQVNSKADVKAILKSWDEFKQTIPSDISVQQAQELKKGTYKILADKYAHMGTVGDEAGTQSQMALARALRKGIEQRAPGVVAPNKEMAALINAIEIAERRAGTAGNRDIAGIAWLAEHPAAAGGMLADRSPWIKSLLARYMYSGMPTTGAMVGAIEGADFGRKPQ